MDFWRLSVLMLIAGFASITSCEEGSQEQLTYDLYDVGASNPSSTLTISSISDTTRVLRPLLIQTAIDIDTLVFEFNKCQSKIPLKVGEIVDNPCVVLNPFVGERVTVLDIKDYSLQNRKITIYKLFSESGTSYANSSMMLYWRDEGIIFFSTSPDTYAQIRNINDVDGIMDSLLKILKRDSSFTEIYTIPTLPPIPDY